MLSICIPVYNTDVTVLVRTLHQQCTECKIDFEIICLDDFSTSHKEKNKTLGNYPTIKHSELNENVGRSAIRNLLASQAIYPYILLLDCDVMVSRPDFIKKYLDAIQTECPVIVGGREYTSENLSKETKLHFNYGSKREVVSVATRKRNPYSSFVTGNFLIQKKIFDTVGFSSSLTEYGHEDTLFGIELKKHRIPILHIDNPTIHIGLESNEIFLHKQLTAVKNLAVLIRQGHDMSSIFLYKVYFCLKKYKVLGLFIFTFRLFQPLVKKILESGNSSWLILFDVIRLYELSIELKN